MEEGRPVPHAEGHGGGLQPGKAGRGPQAAYQLRCFISGDTAAYAKKNSFAR